MKGSRHERKRNDWKGKRKIYILCCFYGSKKVRETRNRVIINSKVTPEKIEGKENRMVDTKRKWR